MKKKITGIYKITSPSGRIYIGQSVNIASRWYGYLYFAKRRQTRLYNSFQKYGVDQHRFEVIEECKKDKLNERERYWQDYYDVLNQHTGLNCRLTGTEDNYAVFSEELKVSLSNGQKGRKMSEKTKEKWKEQRAGGGNSRALMVINLETGIYYECVKDAAFTIGVTRKTLSNRLNKIQRNDTAFRYVHKELNEIVECDTSHIINRRFGELNPMNKLVLNMETGVYYENCRDAAKSINMNHFTLGKRLRGENKRHCVFKYV